MSGVLFIFIIFDKLYKKCYTTHASKLCDNWMALHSEESPSITEQDSC